MTFDGWNAQYYGDCLTYGQDSLMHFRTKGSKNGVRRYQQEDGTWTPLGLRERRIREGFGEGRAARKEARRQARAERRAARAAARSENLKRATEYKAQKDEERRKRNPKNLTDAELKAGIERLQMEQTYREMMKSPTIKAAEKMVAGILERKAAREERAYLDKKASIERKHELEKLKEQTKQTELRSKADEARANADKARAETDKLDIEKGTRMAKLKNDKADIKLKSKRLRSDTTITGGVKKLVNRVLSGKGEASAVIRKGEADARVAERLGATEANIAVTQAKILRKYNKKLKGRTARAAIPEGGYGFTPRPSNKK